MILPGVPALSASGSHFQGVTRLLLENLMLSHAHEEDSGLLDLLLSSPCQFAQRLGTGNGDPGYPAVGVFPTFQTPQFLAAVDNGMELIWKDIHLQLTSLPLGVALRD